MMTIFTEPNSFGSAVKPLFVVLKVLGLAPIKRMPEYDPRFHRKFTFGILQTVAYAITLITGASVYFYHASSRNWYNTTLDIITYLFASAGATVCFITALVTCASAPVSDIIRRIRHMDEKLFAKSWIKYPQVRTFLCIQFFFTALSLISGYSVNLYIRYNARTIWQLPAFINELITITGVLLYMDILLLLGKAMDYINKEIEAIREGDNAETDDTQSAERCHYTTVVTGSCFTLTPLGASVSTLRTCEQRKDERNALDSDACSFKHSRETFFYLRDTMLLVDCTFGFLALVVVVNKASYVILHFNMVIAVIKKTVQESISFLFPAAMWIAIDTLQMALVMFFPQYVAEKTKKTVTLLQKLSVKRNISSAAVAELKVFSQQVFESPVVFSAWGFFSLDRSSFFSLLGSLAAYVVLLVQLH